MKYELIEKTPEYMQCFIGQCPAVYELKNACFLGQCPTIYKHGDFAYLIIGKQRDPKDFGLEKKVGKDESLVEIPRELLADIVNEK